MKFMFVVALLVATALAAPQGDPAKAEILEYTNDNIGVGGYNFAYRTSDGTYRTETAVVKNAGQENQFLEVTGTVEWVGADGQKYSLNYQSGENGATAQGAHLPQ